MSQLFISDAEVIMDEYGMLLVAGKNCLDVPDGMKQYLHCVYLFI